MKGAKVVIIRRTNRTFIIFWDVNIFPILYYTIVWTIFHTKVQYNTISMNNYAINCCPEGLAEEAQSKRMCYISMNQYLCFSGAVCSEGTHSTPHED